MVEETYINNITDSHLLVVDLDGTLVNTDMANYLSYKDAIQQIIGLDLAIAHNKYERFTREKLFSIVDNLTKLQYKKIIDIKNEVYPKYLSKSKLNLGLVKPGLQFCGPWSSFRPSGKLRNLAGHGPQGGISFPRSPWECSLRRSSGASPPYGAALRCWQGVRNDEQDPRQRQCER